MLKALFLFLAIHLVALSFSSAAETKGLLPEVRLNNNENENESKSLTSEIMITRSENKAIEALQKLIKSRKGNPEEVDLLYRLAELYMRRSKSGRFFDLHQGTRLLKLSAFPIPNETGKGAVAQAVGVYNRIEKEFPKFDQMDSVYFNNAFANQQLGKITEAQSLYSKLLTRFPNSSLVPDGTLAYGELLYDQQKFGESLKLFQSLEKYPKARVYSYGMYKAAWAYYNMHDSDNGIKKLIEVVNNNPPIRDGEVPTNRHNLRREALRDLTIFIGDVYPADKLYDFFAKITDGEELAQSIIDLAKLYEAHARPKEMNVFLGEYLEKQASGAAAVRAHLFLVDANETLKQREQVVTHLSAASQLCEKDSAWKSAQKKDTIIESCEEGFRRTSLEIAAKWWDIWLKNKQNAAFSALTEQAFKIILEGEDPKKPDSKTRFAYAELLFQQGKFAEASSQYKIVGAQTTDVKMALDADYAALFAKEKSIELDKDKKKDPVKEAERKELALVYLAKHPNGPYARSVQFKLGHIAYQENNYEEAQKRLTPLAEAKLNDDFKKKSEDLLLDILNLRKDYAGIQKISKKMLAGTIDNVRKENLNRILEEASFAEIQDFAKTGDKDLAAQKLSNFAKEHANSKLANEAMWQSLSLSFAQGKTCDAAEVSVKFAEKYPQDKRSPDALKEAAQSFADCGDLSRSAETLLKVSEVDKKNKLTHLELAADMYILEKKSAEARRIYNEIANQADKKSLERIYTKLLSTYKETDRNIEFEKLENKILNQGIEPYATQIVTRRAKSLYEAGKLSQAFELAMKANSRDSAPEVRAEARLLQARILEKELTTQSVKAREEKFALVLSMKTEKLDKAQTAYVTTLKMAKDPFIQLEALRGMDRSYGNYIESLKAMPLPASLNAADQAALRAEVAKIIAPIQDKKKDNEAKLRSLAATQGQGLSSERNFTGLGADKTVVPLVNYPAADKLKPFYPDSKVTKPLDMEKQGRAMVRNKDQRALGLYYLSLAAESRSYTEKALWLIETSLKADPNSPPALYQKARLLYQVEGMAAAKPSFDKVLETPMSLTEIQTFRAIRAFSEGDFTQAVEKFSRIKKEDIYNYELGPLFSESYAQKGETEKALYVVKDLLQDRKDNVDLLLEQAHLLETYKAAPSEALAVYEKLQKIAKQADLKDWLDRKINYLKNPNRVVQNVITGD